MSFDYDIAIIGAGCGGLLTATAASTFGAKILLIEKNLVGGYCLNLGRVPNNAFLHISHTVDTVKYSKKFGLDSDIKTIDTAEIAEYVQSVVSSLTLSNPESYFKSLGINIVNSSGKILDKHRVSAGGKTYTAKTIVIATGASSSVPNIQGIESCTYYTSENIINLEKIPKSLIVIGANSQAIENAQAFAHLGAKVTLIDKSEYFLPNEEEEVSYYIGKKLEKDGVKCMLSSKVISIKQDSNLTVLETERNGEIHEIVGEALYVSLNRVPNTSELGLEDLGIITNENGYIVVSDKMQTNIDNIFACGSVTNSYQYSHIASYQAVLTIQNALFGFSKTADYSKISWATFTKPEIARVGLSEREALELDDTNLAILVPFSGNDRAKIEADTDGFLKLILDKKGLILGATIVADNASELIAIASLAINARLNVTSLYDMILPYPTRAEIYKTAAKIYRKQNISEWKISFTNNNDK